MAEPIRQEIQTTYDGKGVADAARDMQSMAQATDQAGDQASETAEATKELGDATQQAGEQAADASRAAEQIAESTVDQASAAGRATDAERELERATTKIEAATSDATDAVKEHTGAVEADEAATKEQATATETATEQTKKGGAAAEETASKLTLKERAVMAVTGALGSMVAQWLALSAVSGAIISFFTDLADQARKAAAAVVDVGRGLRGLSANVGGELAANVFRDVTAVAGESGFNVAGRSQLLEGVAAATDVREGMTREQINDLTRQLATLQRGTGVGGKEGFGVIQSLTSNLGMTDEQAVDAGAVLLNSGISPQAVTDIVERGGNVGGVDMLATILAARSQGLDINKVGRSLPSLVGALTRRGQDGGLAETLTNAGVTEDMDINQRIAEIVQRRSAGEISEGQFFEALGGEENARLIAPIVRTIRQPRLIAEARAQLLNDQAAESQIQEVLANPFVQAEERQNRRELAAQVERETSGLTARGEELADFDARHENVPRVVRWLSAIGNLPNVIFPGDPNAASQQDQHRITVNIYGQAGGTAYNRPDPNTENTPRDQVR